MKTQLKILAFTLATFNLTQAMDTNFKSSDDKITNRSSASNAFQSSDTRAFQIDDQETKKASFSNVEVNKVKPRDSRCGYLMSYFKSIPSIYDLPSTLSVYASDVYKAVSEKAQVFYNSTAKNVAYYTKAARENVWGTSGRRIIKEEQAEAEIAEKRDLVKEEDKKEVLKVEEATQQEVVAKKKAKPQQAEAEGARKRAKPQQAEEEGVEKAHAKQVAKMIAVESEEFTAAILGGLRGDDWRNAVKEQERKRDAAVEKMKAQIAQLKHKK